MAAAINPTTIGMSTYTVSGSANAWFYLAVDLDPGDEAGFEMNAPGATVTLAQGAVSLGTISGAPVTHNDGTREIVTAAAGGFISIAITAVGPFTATFTVRASAIPAADSCSLSETGGGQIKRVLADPTVTVFNPTATVFEVTPITLSGTAQFTTVPTGGAVIPAGTPAPPPLRAIWSQVTPASVSAPPPSNVATQAVPAAAALPANVTFNAPTVHSAVNLNYRLTAFYDPNGNSVADADEPFATADVAREIKQRTKHMILVVDRSGSMQASMPGTSITRWEFARRAAHVWADVWTALRQGVSTNDQAGVMVFEAQNCGWTGATAAPIDILLPSGGLGSVGSLDTNDLDLGEPGSCTPIGDALIKAMETFSGLSASPDDLFVIVLLTDGYENSGAIVVEEDSPKPPGATTNFHTARVQGPLASINSRMLIYAIGLGSPGSVQESALQDLTDEPTATTELGKYRLVQANQLMATFAEMLGDVTGAQPVVPVPSPVNLSVNLSINANEERLVIVVQWDNITDDLNVFRTVAGTEVQVTGSGITPPTGVTYERRGKHGIVSVDLRAHLGDPAPASTWRVQHVSGGTTQPPVPADRFLALVDLFVKADISFDRRRYSTGRPVEMTCQLTAGGQPIPGARVWVELARPGESLGTFLGQLGSRYDPSSSDDADPLAPKAAMLHQLLRITEHPDLELPTVTPTGIFRDGSDQLWDDGLHRDGAAGDGVYRNVYLGLDMEGTYTWRFTIEGTTPEGEPFSRQLTRAFWASVRVDPTATKCELRDLGSFDGNPAVLITVTPVDRNGQMLGPFRPSDVVMKVDDDGLFIRLEEEVIHELELRGVIYPQPDGGDLLSHYDGRYSRLLIFRKEGNFPRVAFRFKGARSKRVSSEPSP